VRKTFHGCRPLAGVAPWQVRQVGGIEWIAPGESWGTGDKMRIHAAEYPWDWETECGAEWREPVVLCPGYDATQFMDAPVTTWKLTPATLPSMEETLFQGGRVRMVDCPSTRDDADSAINESKNLPEWQMKCQSLICGKNSLCIPARTRLRVLLDLNDYLCGYPRFVISGGKDAWIRCRWAEALFVNRTVAKGADRAESLKLFCKGNRDDIQGKFFRAAGNEFVADGGANRVFEPLWWETGRYIEIYVETADEPLVVNHFGITATGYPLVRIDEFRSSDESLHSVAEIAFRTLRRCSHETYMDCPYYEQMMYIGDTRLQALVTYVTSKDARLPHKALKMFDLSRLPSGLTWSRFPARYQQFIPPFSLWYVCMVHDYFMWRRDPDFVQALLPGVQAILEYFIRKLDAEYLLSPLGHFPFVDWVPTWRDGTPPGAFDGHSSILDLQLLLALQAAADMEEFFGQENLTARYRQVADRMSKAIFRTYWSETRKLLSDTPEGLVFSEHAQSLAILGGVLEEDVLPKVLESLEHDTALSRTTLYFTHYLFEALAASRRADMILERMDMWRRLSTIGLLTCPEQDEQMEPTRSDCHAWGAHPLFHFHASLLGVRPGSPSFGTVCIVPQLGGLKEASGTMPHPDGMIRTGFSEGDDGHLTGTVELPGTLSGELVWRGNTVPLHSGKQEIKLTGVTP